MKWKLSDKAKATIQAVAPGLAAALGGPLAGAAAGALVSALGGDEKAAEDALIAQNPETLLKLRQAENDFTLKMRELDIEPEKLASADRADARSLAKVDMRPQMILSGVFVVGYFIIFWWLLMENVELNIRQSTMVNVLMGVLTAGMIKIMDFWFGSTAGSREKSVLLANSKPADLP
jgi:hypothetical protein